MTSPTPRPPAWFILLTGILATLLLLMAVTETSLLGHYLIDQGEFVAIVGLGLVTVSAFVLYRRGQLTVSLPFVLPWLVYPVVTQGDQVIDNLSINWMRILVHLLLALIFAAPAMVLAFGARALAATERGRRAMASSWARWIPGCSWLAQGREREGVSAMAVWILSLEFVAAHITLGLLMMGVLVVMVALALAYGASTPSPASAAPVSQAAGERRTLVWVLVGVCLSGGLYAGYKNRPGAYQGSPSYILDPSQQAAGYDLAAVPLPGEAPIALPPEVSAAVAQELAQTARAFDRLVDGYYIAERNYTFDFHNELFLRRWPVLPEYRTVALSAIAESRALAQQVKPADVPPGPWAAWMEEVRRYLAFNFQRAATLERLTGEFEKTKAGLQHAAHIYEGEGKLVGLGLMAIEDKYRASLQTATMADVVAEYRRDTARIYARYSGRIVGF